METYTQQEDITVFGRRVTTFPNGIKEAFNDLVNVLGNKRAYYGISWFAGDGSIIYYAMAPETFTNEAKQYPYETFVLPKGDYVTETIMDWMSQTGSIKDTFCRLMADSRPGKERPCIEWYQSDDKMLCMIKSK